MRCASYEETTLEFHLSYDDSFQTSEVELNDTVDGNRHCSSQEIWHLYHHVYRLYIYKYIPSELNPDRYIHETMYVPWHTLAQVKQTRFFSLKRKTLSLFLLALLTHYHQHIYTLWPCCWSLVPPFNCSLSYYSQMSQTKVLYIPGGAGFLPSTVSFENISIGRTISTRNTIGLAYLFSAWSKTQGGQATLQKIWPFRVEKKQPEYIWPVKRTISILYDLSNLPLNLSGGHIGICTGHICCICCSFGVPICDIHLYHVGPRSLPLLQLLCLQLLRWGTARVWEGWGGIGQSPAIFRWGGNA